MSWVYWGIVGGLMAMVTTLLVCVGLMYPKSKTSSEARSGRIDQPGEATTPAVAHRRAA